MRVMAIDYGDVRTGIAVSDQLGVLAGEQHRIMTGPEMRQTLDALAAHEGELDRLHARQAEELNRSVRQLTRIPAEEYMAYAQLTNQASDVWRRAKQTSGFALFRPCLEKLVEYNRRFAGYYPTTRCWTSTSGAWTWDFWTTSFPCCGSGWCP